VTSEAVQSDILTAEQVRRMFSYVAAVVVSKENDLCEADRKIGDGDHGIGMRRGFTAVIDTLSSSHATAASTVITEVGRTLLSETGGAAGVMFGLMFAGLGTPEGNGDESLSVASFAAAQRVSLQQLMNRGKAQPGDKTMVDALVPAVEALEAAAVNHMSWTTALRHAADAAERGAERTKTQIAKFGKARTLGARSLGYPDPGSLTVAIIFRAMAEWSATSTTRQEPVA
jgi:phosphoenolpyruvate---glycerone phosphotransferase subunit DhaL